MKNDWAVQEKSRLNPLLVSHRKLSSYDFKCLNPKTTGILTLISGAETEKSLLEQNQVSTVVVDGLQLSHETVSRWLSNMAGQIHR